MDQEYLQKVNPTARIGNFVTIQHRAKLITNLVSILMSSALVSIIFHSIFRMTPTADDNADPSANLMNMMKQMYQDGDDEMKRTIAKAWTESQSKSGTPSLMPGMDMGM